eukprot:TRINITY_DN50340_c0_g1_i1.p1 TRINITY_DN50340_c0_g1~~TRINITY_DN50340_c0_g1_i1.p1  ORF type:complete len:617 (-),score=120.47 TRINITY_DN50340_c0_g1_i1:128-1978(-)
MSRQVQDEEAGFGDVQEDSVERENVPCSAYFAYLLGIAAPVLVIVGLLQVLQEEGGIPLLAAGGVLYLAYLIESLCLSKTSKYLTNVMSEAEFAQYMEQVQKAAPRIDFTIQNWHWEERVSRDKDGNEQRSRVRVDTHRATRRYGINSHLDETLSPQQTMAMFHLLNDGSNDVSDEELQKKAGDSQNRLILLCHMPLVLHPVSSGDEMHYHQEKDVFYRANTTDVHQDKHEHRGLTCEYHERVMVILSGGTDSSYEKPMWMNCCVFFICTLFFMSVPFRMYFFSKCQKSDWLVFKHFSHRTIDFKEETPVKSRQHGTSAASRAFKAVRREAASIVGAADSAGLRGIAQNATLDVRGSELQLAEEVPSYWKNRDLNVTFDDKVKLPAEQIPKFQKLLDVTFKDKATRDRKTGEMPKRLKVEHVIRMEDSAMWSRFLSKRAQLAAFKHTPLADLPGSGRAKTARPMSDTEAALLPDCLGELTTELNETYLFHGSGPAGALGIGENGFDMSRVGSNVGTMFGGGAYMAEASSKSDEYAQEDGSGVFAGKLALLLCRTLLGNMFYITESNIPIIEEALATGKYHAVLGDRESVVGTYREFVVFDEAQLYPEYVIIYKRCF